MSTAPAPTAIFQRAVDEGERRLDQTTIELIATSFITGFTVVIGIAALGITHATVEPQFGEVARLAGALTFGVSLVFLVIGRAELFNENFFDPSAAAVGYGDLLVIAVVSMAGNFVGGLGLVVFSHTAQVYGSRDAPDD